MGKVRADVVVTGLVQGVFFRASTRDEAKRLSLRGWVKNRPNGSVEALFEGEKADVEAVVRWCRKGPLGARVEDLRVEWKKYSGEFDAFEIAF